MKKSFALFTLCLVLILGVVAVAAFTLHDARDQVTVTAETLAGDPAAAQGLVAEQSFHYNYKLYWDVTIPLDDPAAASTVFTRKKIVIQEAVPDSRFYLTFPYIGYGTDELTGWPNLMDLFLDVGSRTPDGDTYLELVSPKDYMEYYPLECQVELYANDPAKAPTVLDLTTMAQEFFRLPVLETDRWFIQITTEDDGDFGYLYVHPMADAFVPNTLCALGDDFALLTFGGVEAPILPDFSQVPGGFGLYRVDFAPGQDGVPVLVPDSLRNVYPLPQNTWVADLALSPDQKEVYLLTIQGDETLCTVLDGETIAAKQTFSVPLPPPETTVTAKGTENIDLGTRESRLYIGIDMICGENYLCFQDEENFHLFTKQANGGYAFQFTAARTGQMLVQEGPQLRAMVWTGDKLASASAYVDGLHLSVFGSDGTLLYDGRYETSLPQGQEDPGVSLLFNYPLILTWK